MKLHIGVVDLPYTNGTNVTTGDVATFLEDKYHVMETFYNEHAQEVADELAEGIQGALESIMMGAPAEAEPFASGTSEIDHLFRKFLSEGEMERLGYPGVPTKAAIERRSSRFKKKRGPNKRPSFIDTGLYESSEKSWVD